MMNVNTGQPMMLQGRVNLLNQWAKVLEANPNMEMNNLVNRVQVAQNNAIMGFERLYSTRVPTELNAINKASSGGSNLSEGDIWELNTILANAAPTGTMMPTGGGMVAPVMNPFMNPADQMASMMHAATFAQPSPLFSPDFNPMSNSITGWAMGNDNALQLTPSRAGLASNPMIAGQLNQMNYDGLTTGAMGFPAGMLTQTAGNNSTAPVADTGTIQSQIKALFMALSKDQRVATLLSIGKEQTTDSPASKEAASAAADAAVVAPPATPDSDSATDSDPPAEKPKASMTASIAQEATGNNIYNNTGNIMKNLVSGKSLDDGLVSGFTGSAQTAALNTVTSVIGDDPMMQGIKAELEATNKVSKEVTGILNDPIAQSRFNAFDQLKAQLPEDMLKGIAKEVNERAKKGKLDEVPAQDMSSTFSSFGMDSGRSELVGLTQSLDDITQDVAKLAQQAKANKDDKVKDKDKDKDKDKFKRLRKKVVHD